MNPLEGRIWDLERRLVRLDWMLARTEAGAISVQQKLREVEWEFARQALEDDEEGGEEEPPVITCSPCNLPQIDLKLDYLLSSFEGIGGTFCQLCSTVSGTTDLAWSAAAPPAVVQGQTGSGLGHWVSPCVFIDSLAWSDSLLACVSRPVWSRFILNCHGSVATLYQWIWDIAVAGHDEADCTAWDAPSPSLTVSTWPTTANCDPLELRNTNVLCAGNPTYDFRVYEP